MIVALPGRISEVVFVFFFFFAYECLRSVSSWTRALKVSRDMKFTYSHITVYPIMISQGLAT